MNTSPETTPARSHPSHQRHQRRANAAGRHLSYVLRHDPASIGLTLQPGGWVPVVDLLAALDEHGHRLTRTELVDLVAADTKGRYTLHHGRIRAAQGHSVDVDLGLTPAAPPERLFHGTIPTALRSIRETGLRPGCRQHVHLSADVETATVVGSRRGDPVILEVTAGDAHRAGVEFFVADNGVWLTGPLDLRWIVFPEHLTT